MIEQSGSTIGLTGKELPVYRIHSTANLCTININAQLNDEIDVVAVVEVNGQLYGISGKELAGVARRLVMQQTTTGAQTNVATS